MSRNPKSLAPRSQVDAAPFKAWFGDSIVTESGKVGGKPLVVYHGSSMDSGVEDEGIFVFNSADNLAGWFTPSIEKAEVYATRWDVQQLGESCPHIYPAFLKIDNPLIVPGECQGITKENVEFLALAKSMGCELDESSEDYVWEEFNRTEFIEAAIAAGYDGIYAIESGEETFCVFRPHQVKSATGNNGDFCGTNPDIRFSNCERAR